MSAGSVSLTSSVRNCTFDAGWANKVQSDRFLNPMNAICPTWNGINLKGQQVCPDSFYTKSPGCNSALDRVIVENNVERPEYFSYIGLSAAGINGSMYGNEDAHAKTLARQRFGDSRNKYTGNYGKDFNANVKTTAGDKGCSVGAYEQAMAQEAQSMRGQGFAQNGYEAYNNRRSSGMY